MVGQDTCRRGVVRGARAIIKAASSLVWTRPGAVRIARAKGRFRAVWRGVCGATSARAEQVNALSGTPLSGAPQGTLAVVRGVAGEGGDGEGLGGALRRGGEHGVQLASPVSGGGAERFGGAQGVWKRDETYVLESRKLGRKARRRGARPGLSREGAGSHGGRPSGRRSARCCPDAAALAAALDPVVAKDALLVSDGGASYPPCAAALGVSHEALNRSMGERVRGDLHVQTVNSRHSRLKDFLRPRRGIATRYLDNYLSWFHLVGLAPGANDRACLAAAVEVTHTIH